MPRPFELTEPQQRALDLSKSVAVTAGAGSGKTGVLVMRYIDTLSASTAIGVRNVLAITFTDKAAAEMKHRVREEIEERIRTAQDAQRWRAVLETLDCAAISTIHSFCLSLLREHPIEAGVDPAAQMLDETQSRRLRRQAIDEALQSAGEGGGEMQEQVRMLLRAWNRGRVVDNLKLLFSKADAVEECVRFYRESSPEQIKQRMLKAVKKAWMARAAGLFSQANVRRLESFICRKPDDKIELVRRQVIEAIRAGLDKFEYDTLVLLVPDIASIERRGGSAGNWDDFDGCKGLLAELKEKAVALQDLTPDEFDWAAAPVLRAVAGLYARARELYEDYKGQGRALDFDDLQTRALALLAASPEIRAMLHERFRAVLVDEFQDTNRLQWEIIRQVVQDAAGVIPPGRLFIVGDPKQSIYGFREAEIRVFGEVKKNFLDEAAGVEMDDNFRAAPAPINFVNKLMTGLMGTAGQDFDPEYRRLIPKRTDGLPGSVTLLLPFVPDAEDEGDAEGQPADGSAATPTEAELVARQILSIVQTKWQVWDKQEKKPRPARFGDVAILMRARTRQGLFEEALRKAFIPFNVLGGLGLYARQEVLDLANAARFMTNRNDDLALAAVLRSPMAGLSDDALLRVARTPGERLWDRLLAADEAAMGEDGPPLHRIRVLLNTWLRWSRRLPTAELLGHVLEETGAWGSTAAGERGEQTAANIEKILSLARSFPDLAAFVAELDDLIESGAIEGEAQTELEQSEAVKIMTVHAAKGLEFPIVCVVDTAYWRTPGYPLDTCFHRDLDVGVKMRDPEGRPRNTVLRRLILDRVRQEEEAESIRLLYVALTRGRDHLVISGTPPGKNGTWLRMICRQMGIDPKDPRDIPEATVHVDASGIPIDEPQPPASLAELLSRYERAAGNAGTERTGTPPQGKLREAVGRLAALKPIPDAPALPQFAPTALERYLECPYSYFLTEVLGVPHTGALMDEMPTPALIFSSPGEGHPPRSSYLNVGIVAHRFFEEITRIQPGREREALLRFVREQEVPDAAEQARIVDAITGMIGAFRASDFGKRILAAAESYTEIPFSVPIGRGVVSGKIDLLFRDASGWKILDYKTDDVRPDALAARAERYRAQLLTYSIAVGKLLGCEPPEACLYFTRPARPVQVRVSREDAAAFELRLAAAIDRILKHDFEPAGTCPETCRFLGSEYCPSHAPG